MVVFFTFVLVRESYMCNLKPGLFICISSMLIKMFFTENTGKLMFATPVGGIINFQCMRWLLEIKLVFSWQTNINLIS